MNERPKCEVVKTNEITGEEYICGNLAHLVRYNKSNNTPVYRRFRNGKDEYKYICVQCHKERYPKLKYGDNVRRGRGYRNFKKDYCENSSGILGFLCTASIIDDCVLTVDHKDGNRNNNDLTNLQTLCHNCHSYKTKVFKDAGVKKNHIPPSVPSLENL